MTIVHPPSLERDTNAIEHLDFAPPCEYQHHPEISNEPAVFIVWYSNPLPCGCPGGEAVNFCAPCWEYRNSYGEVRCHQCGGVFDAWTSILRVERI